MNEVLLCKRAGEADLDEVFSFPGGKMETTDESLIAGMQREKNEEIGVAAKIKLYPQFSTNLLYKKKDGNTVVLPHYLAIFKSGEIHINEEYSEYCWVKIQNLRSFEPKVSNIPDTVVTLLKLLPLVQEADYVEL